MVSVLHQCELPMKYFIIPWACALQSFPMRQTDGETPDHALHFRYGRRQRENACRSHTTMYENDVHSVSDVSWSVCLLDPTVSLKESSQPQN